MVCYFSEVPKKLYIILVHGNLVTHSNSGSDLTDIQIET